MELFSRNFLLSWSIFSCLFTFSDEFVNVEDIDSSSNDDTNRLRAGLRRLVNNRLSVNRFLFLGYGRNSNREICKFYAQITENQIRLTNSLLFIGEEEIMATKAVLTMNLWRSLPTMTLEMVLEIKHPPKRNTMQFQGKLMTLLRSNLHV